MTRLPALAISVAATRPARPPPTTITSASSAIASPPAGVHSTLHGVVFAIFCPGPAVRHRIDPVPTHHALALERDLGTNEIACPAKPPPTFALKGLKRVVLIAVNGKWFLCVTCLCLDGDLTSGCSGLEPSRWGMCSRQATLNLNLFCATPGIWTKSRSGNTLRIVITTVVHHSGRLDSGLTGA